MNSWDVQSLGSTLNLTIGQDYTLTFWGKAASVNSSFTVVVQGSIYMGQTFSLGTEWTQYTWNFTAQEASPTVRLRYPQIGTMWLDDIQVEKDGDIPSHLVLDKSTA